MLPLLLLLQLLLLHLGERVHWERVEVALCALQPHVKRLNRLVEEALHEVAFHLALGPPRPPSLSTRCLHD